MLNTQRFYINFVGLFLKKHVCFFSSETEVSFEISALTDP